MGRNMKKTYGLLAVLCIAVLGACSNLLRTGGEGTIVIAFGTGGRLAVQDSEIAAMTFQITLTGPGEAIVQREFSGSGQVSIAVMPGEWIVSIRAIGAAPEYNNYISTLLEYPSAYLFPPRMLRAFGVSEEPLEVRTGQRTLADVRMISAAEVSNHAQLLSAIGLARTDGREKIIMLTGNITAHSQYRISSGNITLASEYNVRITRAPGNEGAMFDAAAGTLRLGRSGMEGSITLDGGGISASGPIINIRGNVVMNRGVILTGNENTATGGGGVLVASGGTFTKYGGRIYGADRPVGTRNAALLGASIFVERDGIARFSGDYAVTYGDAYGNIRSSNYTLPHVFYQGAALHIDLVNLSPDIDIQGPAIRLVGTAAETSAVITVTNPGQYSPGSIRWYFHEIQITGAMVGGSSGETLTLGPIIHGSALGPGTHFLTVEANVNGVSFSRRIAFTVTL